MEVNLPFIAIGLIDLGTGVASAVVLAGYTWWAPLVLAGAWGATHWLLRESAIWKDRNTDEVREASLHAEYAFRLAVDPPPAKELRVFGLSDWALDRFTERRRQLFDLQQAATRLRERSAGDQRAAGLGGQRRRPRGAGPGPLRGVGLPRPGGRVRPGRRRHRR